ncbi:FecR family protein [Niabella sp. CJ426]|uniref:FecR family protein n=1 Tax=Niabella sp. CJ426 TaxID=3393740 RepID=UPI003D003E62
MEHNKDTYFIGLIERYMNNACSRDEMDEVLMLAEKDPQKLYHALKEHWRGLQLVENDNTLSIAPVFDQATEIEERYGGQAGDDTERKPRLLRKRTRSRFRVGIAAVVVVTIGIAVYFLNQRYNNTPGTAPQVITDVTAPVKTKATVRLANGQTIALDSLLSGTLAVQEDGKLIKNANGQLVYEAQTTAVNHTPVYNTLDNPKGSRVVDIRLADGTQVWLNAGSSITYPVAFTGIERRIQLKGEAYLDVSHNAARPFIVQTGDLTIQVLGTGFNVDAYATGDPVKVTLFKGSVKLSNKSASSLLKPGQQASVKEEIRISNNIDLDDVLAWKNNKFIFDNSSIQQIMRQLEQWYDIEVVYHGVPTTEAFIGSISRDVKLSQILSLLSETNAVHFEQQGKKVIVKR